MHQSDGKNKTVDGWLVVELPTPLKNDGVRKCWDDDIPNCFWKVIKFHGASHHQPDGVSEVGRAPHYN